MLTGDVLYTLDDEMSLRKVPCCSGSYLFLLVEGIIRDNELGSFSPEITLLS